MSTLRQPTPPEHVLVLSFDTLGDVTLRQPLLTGLLDRGFRVTMAVRRSFAPLVPFLDRRLESFVADFDPYAPADQDWRHKVAHLAQDLRALRPDRVVCAPWHRTYVDNELLSSLADLPSHVLGTDAPASPLRQHVGVHEDDPELAKNQALYLALTADRAPLPPPRLTLGEHERSETHAILAQHGLAPGAFAIGAPAGTVTTALKAWPAEEFADTVAYLAQRHALRTLLIGVRAEAAHLEQVAALALERGAKAEVFIGGSDDLGTLLGLIAASKLYVGSDSGPMHFAAALDVPVFARFGGGHWPRFLPAASRGVVATQKLPCFGCGWNCWLEEPACVRRVTSETVQRGLDEILSGRLGLRVDEGMRLDPLVSELIRGGAARQRGLVTDLRQRLDASEADRATAHAQLTASEADRAARLQVIEDVYARLAASEADRAGLQARLTASEADRADLQARLAASEADRAAQVQVMEEVQARLTAIDADRVASIGARDRRTSELEQQLAASEADRAARLDVIHQYARQARAQHEWIETLRRETSYLSSAGGALRVLGVAGLRRLGLYGFARRHRARLNRLLAPLAGRPMATAPEAASALVQDQADLASTAFEAISIAHALGSDLHALALERLYRYGAHECGARAGATLCLGGSQRMLAAAYLLASGGGTVTLLGRSVPAGLAVAGLAFDVRMLGDWLIGTGQASLASFATLVLDEDCDADLAALLTARLAPGTRVLVAGPLPKALDGGTFRPEAPDLFASDHPPPAWIEAPRALPSGRPWPRITVVTVSFNQAGFLEETLRSVLEQDYPNLEYIVVDGGSTDGSAAILERYRERLAWCVSEPDRGQSHALNKGFARATGSILAWLNSDDRYAPGALRRAAIAFDAYGDADMLSGGCALVEDVTGEVARVHHSALPAGHVRPLPIERLLDIDGSWLRGDFFFQPEVFWTRALWERSGGAVAEELHYSMDYDLWVRFALQGARIAHIPDLLALYRVHAQQKTAGADLPYLPELRRVAAGFLAAGTLR